MNALNYLSIFNKLNVARIAGKLKAEELMLLSLIIVLCIDRKCDIYFIAVLLVIFLCDLKKDLLKP